MAMMTSARAGDESEGAAGATSTDPAITENSCTPPEWGKEPYCERTPHLISLDPRAVSRG